MARTGRVSTVPKKKVSVDTQRRLVRLMERAEFLGQEQHSLPLKRIRRAIGRLTRSFGVARPKLWIRSERGFIASYHYDTKMIVLGPQFGKNLFTLAHEFAHHYVWITCGDRAQEHGPTFVNVYGRALHLLRVLPEDAFFRVCRRWGIKYSKP